VFISISPVFVQVKSVSRLSLTLHVGSSKVPPNSSVFSPPVNVITGASLSTDTTTTNTISSAILPASSVTLNRRVYSPAVFTSTSPVLVQVKPISISSTTLQVGSSKVSPTNSSVVPPESEITGASPSPNPGLHALKKATKNIAKINTNNFLIIVPPNYFLPQYHLCTLEPNSSSETGY